MKKTKIIRGGFLFRALICPKCGEKLLHPYDEHEYNKFKNLKNKEFRVKMRIVGNSYTVSIPKEIVSFMNEQKKVMDDMVKLCLEEMGRLSLNFGNFHDVKTNSRVIKAREYKIIKNNKPILHIKQFADSANPKNNKTQVFRNTEKKIKDD